MSLGFLSEALHGNIVAERVASRLLEGNPLGDPAVRHVLVYLPPAYHVETRRYPVVFILSGLFGSSPGWLGFRSFDENVFQLADRLIHSGAMPPALLIFPDCATRYGGSQYLDSTGTGPYMRHLVEELLPQVAAHYRILPGARACAVAGKSSGGFGALRLAMAHPGVFGHAASSAGDLHFEMTMRPELARFPGAIARLGGVDAFLAQVPGLRKLGDDELAALGTIALASCYSPREQAPGFALPIHIESGELDEHVFAEWRAQDPAERLHNHPEEVEALSGLTTLYIEAGNRDEYHADLGARVFAGRCRSLGIDLIHQEFDGGHFNTTWRWGQILPLLLGRMS